MLYKNLRYFYLWGNYGK